MGVFSFMRFCPNWCNEILRFVAANFGWTCNFLASWVLFGVYAGQDWVDYGYFNTYGPDGNIPSGPLGSGVIPISFALCVASTFQYATIIYNHKPRQSEISADGKSGDDLTLVGLKGFGTGGTPMDEPIETMPDPPVL
ncbi:hypothetical protein TrCOL_g3714 [Triparma columacea]|uniref:Uncharacterized protein n=1 Tax=Triparma columacea TaxID=722753 RepID=A0A9W7GB10_9STRA|nr:hypothetical protein TrCOL_g3714 [Triparma columacea]